MEQVQNPQEELKQCDIQQNSQNQEQMNQEQQNILQNQFNIQIVSPNDENITNQQQEVMEKNKKNSEDQDLSSESSDLENDDIANNAQKELKSQPSFKNFKSKNIPKLMKQKTNQMDLQMVDDLTKNIESQHLQNRSRNNSNYIPPQEEEKAVENQKIQYTTEQAAIKIQTFYRKQKAFKHYKKHIRKRARYRMNVIKELINTEIRYVERLTKLRDNGQKPLLEIIGPELTKKIFTNQFGIMINLNTKFSNDMQARFNNNFGFYTKIADIATMCIPYFKLYEEYFSNLDQSQQFIEEYQQENDKFKEFLQKRERTEQFCNQEMKTLLIDPVFRLPKYVLLFKDLLKNTDEDHPDYKNTKQALLQSEILNKHIDDSLKKIISDSKKKDLHMQYPHLEILKDQKRQFLFEDSLNFIHNQEVKPVLVYFLSDLLIITERVISKGLKLNHQEEESYKLISYLYLNELSFTKNVADQKYFKFLFRINGKNDCLTFIASDQEDKKQKMDQIQEIIDNLKSLKKQNGGVTTYPIQVTVLGTEERNSTTFKKYTIYIVEVMIEDIPQKIFVRYSEMVEFEKRIRKDIKNIQLPNLRTYNWLTAHKTKTIEQRKLLIENFIQKVLQSEQIMQSQRKNEILQFLGLPAQFYELPQNYEKIKEDRGQSWLLDRNSQNEEDQMKFSQKLGQKSQTFNNSGTEDDFNEKDEYYKSSDSNGQSNRMTTIQSFSANHVLSLSKLKGANSKRYNTERLSEVFSQTDSKQQEIQIECLDDAKVTCYITPSSRSFEVIQHIAEYIKLQNYLDFKLFLIDEKHNIRVLDDDEQIWRLVVPQEKKQNIFKQFGKNIEKTFGIKKEEKQRIIFKKYLWLDQELEEIDYRSDLVRLHLLRCQIFEDIHNMKHMLDFKSYALFTALNIYINHPEFIQDMVNSRGSYNPQQLKQGGNEVQRMILLNRAKELIPHIIFNANQANNWVENISSYICSIAKELDKIAQENQDMSEEDLYQNMRQSSVDERKEIYTEKQMLAEMVVINSIKQNILFGVTIYFVQTYKKTMQKAIKLGIDIQNNIWFGVKHDCIMFLKPNNKEKMRQYDLEQIVNIEVHPQSIILTLQGEEIDFRFNTFQSYEISQLINEYKVIRQECLKIQQEDQSNLMLPQDDIQQKQQQK